METSRFGYGLSLVRSGAGVVVLGGWAGEKGLEKAIGDGWWAERKG